MLPVPLSLNNLALEIGATNSSSCFEEQLDLAPCSLDSLSMHWDPGTSVGPEWLGSNEVLAMVNNAMLVTSCSEFLVASPTIRHHCGSVFAHVLFNERDEGLLATILNCKEELATSLALSHAKHPLVIFGDASNILLSLGEVGFVDFNDLPTCPKPIVRVIPLLKPPLIYLAVAQNCGRGYKSVLIDAF